MVEQFIDDRTSLCFAGAQPEPERDLLRIDD